MNCGAYQDPARRIEDYPDRCSPRLFGVSALKSLYCHLAPLPTGTEKERRLAQAMSLVWIET